MKYNKTKYPNIYTYETKKGKRYYVRRKFTLNGKQTEASVSGLKTLAEARQALAEIENKISNGDYDPRKNTTVDDYWQIYSENRIKTGRWAPDTIANKDTPYRHCFQKRFGNIRLKDIERLDYEEHITQLLNKYARVNVVQANGIFEAMVNDAVVNGYLDKNPILKIYIGENGIKPKNKQISLKEFRKWDSCAKKELSQYDYTMIRLTYFGLRKSEVFGIKLGSLKLIGGRFRIFLDESRTYFRQEGNKMKTKGSERYVVVDEETTVLLQSAVDFSYEIAKQTGRILNKEDFLFLDVGDKYKGRLGKPVSCSRIYSSFQKVSKKCNIHITPHMMRHFFATQGQIAGVPVEHMAAALGHSTSYMTQQYTHIQDEVASDVTDSFLRAIK
ncbi:site-specific integrase [Streptococcus macedonicus]|uniref:tyrosine-type recombinase/integrase n=1 Tax=Streptococcus macedonicus TaxID=59310 RepID=UPI001896E1C6|nr:site-specific integrase [Streptococcus macedonicus]MBF6976277.1 site-specific integrase [Streptococcus macedonicus]